MSVRTVTISRLIKSLAVRLGFSTVFIGHLHDPIWRIVEVESNSGANGRYQRKLALFLRKHLANTSTRPKESADSAHSAHRSDSSTHFYRPHPLPTLRAIGKSRLAQNARGKAA